MLCTRRDGVRRRRGKTLVLFALLLPALFGMLGLVIDAGMLLASHRQTQTAADAAALAAAADLLDGGSNAHAASLGQTYVRQYNGLPDAAVTVNIPPSQGAYAGNSNYAEAFVSFPVDSCFIPVLSGVSTRTVGARAVAGLEAVPASQTLLALDSNASPGLAVEGGAATVNGSIGVNAEGAGGDATGAAVDLGAAPYAVTTGASGLLRAAEVRVVGGVDAPGRFEPCSGTGASPLHAGVLPFSDPLLHLPPPTVGNGAVNVYPGVNGRLFGAPQDAAVSIAGGSTATFAPGVYRSITVTGDGPGTVTFGSGIYVLLGGQPFTLRIAGGATVGGSGVLFYNTGSDYDVTTGLPDANDGDSPGTDPTAGVTFGAVSLQAASLSLTGLSDASNPLDGMVYYQRRWNVQPASFQGGAGDGLSGGVYARWAKVSLHGPAPYHGNVVAGSLSLLPSTAGGLTVNRGARLGKARQVFLVE